MFWQNLKDFFQRKRYRMPYYQHAVALPADFNPPNAPNLNISISTPSSEAIV